MYTVLYVQYNEAVEFIGVSEDAYLSLGGCWLGGGGGTVAGCGSIFIRHTLFVASLVIRFSTVMNVMRERTLKGTMIYLTFISVVTDENEI